MMRLVTSLLLLFTMVPSVMAQAAATVDDTVVEGDETLTEEVEEALLAQISASDVVHVGRAAIFDGSASVLPEEYTSVTYTWDFGDGRVERGVETVHSYEDPGEYAVTLTLTVDGQPYADVEKVVFVYEHFFVLITDQGDERERIDSLAEYARDRGHHVEVISYFESNSEFIVEEELLQALNEQITDLEQADQIIVWTRGSTGLTLLSRFNKNISDSTLFSDKALVIITDQSFATVRNIADGTFKILMPSRMILTRFEALWMLLEMDTVEAFVGELDSRGIQYEDITGEVTLTPFNFMSFLINYMVERGVPSNSLLLVLMLPVIVTIVAFLKQMVGLTTMGVYTPSIIALSLVALGLKFGLLVFVVVLFFGTLSRSFLRRYRLLYIPRMAIVLTIVSFTILMLLLMGAYFDISQLVSISIFPMLIMSTMVEKFINVQGQRGLIKAMAMIGSTLFVSVICYMVVEWATLKTLMLGHPELIFVFLFVDVFLGRWAGLRVLEYVRFREIFRYSEE